MGNSEISWAVIIKKWSKIFKPCFLVIYISNVKSFGDEVVMTSGKYLCIV